MTGRTARNGEIDGPPRVHLDVEAEVITTTVDRAVEHQRRVDLSRSVRADRVRGRARLKRRYTWGDCSATPNRCCSTTSTCVSATSHSSRFQRSRSHHPPDVRHGPAAWRTAVVSAVVVVFPCVPATPLWPQPRRAPRN